MGIVNQPPPPSQADRCQVVWQGLRRMMTYQTWSAWLCSLVPEGSWIREHVVGKLERLTAGAGLSGSWRAEISYHGDTAG